MNTSYFNAIAGAFLTVVFVVMTVSIASDAIYHTREPVTEGFEIIASEGGPSAGGAKKEEGIPAIAPLLASASIESGEKVFKKCQSCHTSEKGGANKVGPHLWGVVGRPIASVSDFAYSQAMVDFSEGGEKHWSYEDLNHFLDNPKKLINGTKMSFAGVKKTEDRADLIAYLRSLSDSPLPLPSPEESAASETETPAATEASASGTEEAGTAAETDASASGTESTEPAAETEAAAEPEKPAEPMSSTGDTEKPAEESGSSN
jgi:cytochrome c